VDVHVAEVRVVEQADRHRDDERRVESEKERRFDEVFGDVEDAVLDE
jgi:hypothetical protein